MKINKVFIVTAGFVLFFATRIFAQMTQDQAIAKFVAAGLAYQDEQYDKAIADYTAILDSGWESGSVYFNLGNCYFRKQDAGKALLNYERAKRLMPRDSDLRFNESYTRSRLERNNNNLSEGILRSGIKDFVQFYTVGEMVLVMTVLTAAIGIIFLWSLYRDWIGPLRRQVLTLLGVLFIIYGSGLAVKMRLEADAAVVLTKAQAYFEPRDDATVHFMLPQGSKVTILKSEGGWIKIRRHDDKAGWIMREMIERI